MLTWRSSSAEAPGAGKWQSDGVSPYVEYCVTSVDVATRLLQMIPRSTEVSSLLAKASFFKAGLSLMLFVDEEGRPKNKQKQNDAANKAAASMLKAIETARKEFKNAVEDAEVGIFDEFIDRAKEEIKHISMAQATARKEKVEENSRGRSAGMSWKDELVQDVGITAISTLGEVLKHAAQTLMTKDRELLKKRKLELGRKEAAYKQICRACEIAEDAALLNICRETRRDAATTSVEGTLCHVLKSVGTYDRAHV